MLDTLATIGLQILLDLRLLVGGFVDRDANLAAWTGHRAAAQPSLRPLDVEVANLTEIEQTFVEPSPFVHAALVNVVRQMVDSREAGADGRAFGVADRDEIDVVDSLVAIAVDQIDRAAADTLDRWDVELHRPDWTGMSLGAEFDRPCARLCGIAHAKADGAYARSVHLGEGLGEAVGLRVDDEIDVALAVERHRLRTVAGDRSEAHPLEQGRKLAGIGGCVLDELEAVGTHGVVEEIPHPWSPFA